VNAVTGRGPKRWGGFLGAGSDCRGRETGGAGKYDPMSLSWDRDTWGSSSDKVSSIGDANGEGGFETRSCEVGVVEMATSSNGERFRELAGAQGGGAIDRSSSSRRMSARLWNSEMALGALNDEFDSGPELA
jgi:hypothetical protein